MVNERAAASGEESVDFVGTNRLFGDILKYTGRSSRSGPVRSLPIRQSVNGTSQRGRVCARPDPAGAGGVGRKNIVQVNVGANQVSWLPKSGSPWAGEKSVLHKLRFHPDFVAPFPPLANGGLGGVSRDMTFDREIPTPGLIESQHRYSMGMVGFMEMLLRGFIMPRPIPVPIRQAMFRLWQKGYGTRQIAESLGLPCSTVRRLLQRFRLHGTDGLSPDYWHPSVPEAAPSDLVETAVSLRREHPTWGAGLIRVQLLLEAPGRPVPSERTLQRWFVRADQSPAPAGRPPRTHLDRATAPHET